MTAMAAASAETVASTEAAAKAAATEARVSAKTTAGCKPRGMPPPKLGAAGRMGTMPGEAGIIRDAPP